MDLKAVIAGVSFALMWSSAFTSARLVVLDAPPLAALSVRFLISGLIAVSVATALGQSARLTRTHWIAVILFGICQNALYLGLTFVALQTIEASVAVIIASLLPLAVAFASRLFFGDRLSPIGIAGLVIGFAGAVMIMSGRIASGAIDMIGIALMVTALLSLTAATLLLRDALPRGDVLMIVGLQMLVGSLALLPFALALESWEVNWGWRLAGAFTYTILIPGIAATVTWFWLVRRVGPTRAATYHFLNPFLGVTVAAIVLNETVSPRDLAGVAIVAGGILAVQLSRRPKSLLPRQ